MFSFAAGPFDVPDSVRQMCVDTWERLTRPGTSWTGTQRLAITRRARAERLGSAPHHSDLPQAADEAAAVLGARPATTSADWVTRIVSDLGEAQYIELLGIVARVVAIDTFTRLIGVEPQPFPAAVKGDPIPEPPVGTTRRSTAWVSMCGFPVPPNVLSLVPAAQHDTNATAET
ncbi:MAG: hypothetical protein OEM97_08670, partial [Acidimicrobiia bacterium]|nr:hypothetical protein [Acidimicrobiia bacterium]